MRHLFAVALFSVLAGCAHSPEEKPVSAPAAPVPPLPDKAILVGTVVGHDGKPLPAAHVHLGKKSAPVEADGTFRIETDPIGFSPLRFSGVSHAESEAAVWLERGETRIDVQLGTHPRQESPEKVALIVEKDGKLSMRAGQPMQKRADGTFALTLEAPKGRLAYQVLHATTVGNTMNGTQTDRYEYDGGGDYLSVLEVPGGKVEIVFDPSKLPGAAAEGAVKLAKARDRRISELVHQAGEREKAIGAVAMAAMKEGGDPSEAVGQAMEAGRWKEKYADALAAENDPAVREVLRVLSLAIRASPSSRDAETKKLADEALSTIDARSGVWAIDPSAAMTMTHEASDRIRAESYAETLIRSESSPDVSAALLMARMQAAVKAGDTNKAGAVFDELVRRFPQSRYTFLARRVNPKSEVRSGAPIPAFSFPGYADSRQAITSEALRGKTYLISFWASWCKPCIAKLDTLHALNAKYKDRGFTIVAVAIMDKFEAVKTFRELNAKKWPMPWQHAYVPEADAEKVMKSLSAVGLPTSILVGPDGKILATNTEVDTQGLEKWVDAAMAAPRAGVK